MAFEHVCVDDDVPSPSRTVSTTFVFDFFCPRSLFIRPQYVLTLLPPPPQGPCRHLRLHATHLVVLRARPTRHRFDMVPGRAMLEYGNDYEVRTLLLENVQYDQSHHALV